MSQKINVLNGWVLKQKKAGVKMGEDASLKNKCLLKRSNAGINFKQLCWFGGN